MKQIIFIIRQKSSAGLKSIIRQLFESNKGSALGSTLLGLTVTIIILYMFLNIADHALYSYKRVMIAKGIDYAVGAAIQEIDVAASAEGLAGTFDEETGMLTMDNIVLNEVIADNAFYSTLKSNTGIERNIISDKVMIVIVNPYKDDTGTGVRYIIKKGSARATGSITDPSGLEEVINNYINTWWPTSDPLSDKHIIYVNSNSKANEFERKPYYLVFVKDYEIDGLYKNRKATFVGFKGAGIDRGG